NTLTPHSTGFRQRIEAHNLGNAATPPNGVKLAARINLVGCGLRKWKHECPGRRPLPATSTTIRVPGTSRMKCKLTVRPDIDGRDTAKDAASAARAAPPGSPHSPNARPQPGAGRHGDCPSRFDECD